MLQFWFKTDIKITCSFSPCHDPWLESTVLIMKVSQKGAFPSNYWLITCLCTTWKVMSGMWVRKSELAPTPRELNTSYRWVDIQTCALHGLTTEKPMTLCHKHGYWSVETLKHQHDIESSLRTPRHWQKWLQANSKPNAQVSIKWDIYQGNALSSLYFIIVQMGQTARHTVFPESPELQHMSTWVGW